MFILFLVALGLGGAGGWWVTATYINKKNNEEMEFLRRYTDELKLTISYWQNQSAYNKEIHNATIINHNTNLSQTLNSIVTLLQNQNKETLKEDEKQQVENLIKSIKGV